jgi:hypothetical protein
VTMRATWRLRSGARPIVLSFPNQSRFYDATRRAVRFWGHDSAMEASFFVNEDALKRIQSDMGFDEVGVLRAFDLNRERISQSQPKCMGAVTKVLMTCCSATFECVDTNGRSMSAQGCSGATEFWRGAGRPRQWRDRPRQRPWARL